MIDLKALTQSKLECSKNLSHDPLLEYYKINKLLIYILILFFQSLFLDSVIIALSYSKCGYSMNYRFEG